VDEKVIGFVPHVGSSAGRPPLYPKAIPSVSRSPRAQPEPESCPTPATAIRDDGGQSRAILWS